MYSLNPPAVYAHDSVMADPIYRARALRVVAALREKREILPYSDADVPRLIREGQIFKGRVPMGTLAEVADPILLFNTFRFQDAPEAFQAREQGWKKAGADLRACRNSLLGTGAFCWAWYNQKDDPHKADKVCRPCWRIHLQDGCVH